MKTNILDLFLEQSVISQTNYGNLLRFVKKWQIDPFDAILESHIMSEFQLCDAIAKCINTHKTTDLKSTLKFSTGIETKINYGDAKLLKAFVLQTIGGLRLVCANPFNQQLEEVMLKYYPTPLEILVAERSQVVSALDTQYPLGAQINLPTRKQNT